MKKSHALLLLVYVAAVSWLGFRTADAAVVEAFAGDAGVLLVLLLAVLYGTVAALTVWLVTLLTRFTYKLASAGRTPSDTTKQTVQGLVIAALFARLVALAGQSFLGTNAGIAALIVPVLLGIGLLSRDRGVRGLWKGVALAPLFLYVAADAALLSSTPV